MSFQPVDYLVHFSNVLMLASYSVRDILWLRWFAVAAALTNIPYFLLQPTTLWATDYLGAGVQTINLYQILRIYLERRPVILSEDEQKLYNMGFSSLRPREFHLAFAGRRMENRGCWRCSTDGREAGLDRLHCNLRQLERTQGR